MTSSPTITPSTPRGGQHHASQHHTNQHHASQHRTFRSIEVIVRTGTHLLAGTDAPVWIQCVGARRRTQWFRLQTEDGSFARASTERFTLRLAAALDPGEISVVNMQLGSGGAMGGWVLDSVEVDGKRHHFDAWLALDEPPFRLDASSVHDRDARAYDIVIRTSDTFLAGTDAPVFLQLIGSRTTTPWIRLHEPESRPFRAGSVSQFREWSEDVGVVVGVWIRHNNDGVAPGWRVDWLDVDGRRLTFDTWLALDEGHGRLDAFARHRPWLHAQRPLQLSLTTFADLHDRADEALCDDINHANRIFERYGITVERAPAENDVILGDEPWITFQARHAESSDLAAELARMRAARAPHRHQRILPVFYIGGFEHNHGRYPDLSSESLGVFLSLQRRRAAALSHELGRFFGLKATSGAEVERCAVDAPRIFATPHDVMEGDVTNIMSDSELPIGQLSFTSGQFEAMVLGLLRYVS